MALGPILLVQVVLLAVVGGAQIINYPILFSQPIHQRSDNVYKQIHLRSDVAQDLPCPGLGFYAHPQNCSRFYRCVDYAGTGNYYSRYLFECHEDLIWLTSVATCVPGTCISLVQTPSPSPPSEVTTASPSDPTTDSFFGPDPSDVPSPQDPVFEEPESPVTELNPMTDEATTTQAPNPCQYKYVQHALYCNVYHPCDDNTTRYMCDGGTTFDEPNQMCRISAQDENLCSDKLIYTNAFILRSENIGTHVRLPDSLILPTAVPTWSGSGPSYLGQQKPSQAAIAKPQSNFDVRQPAFRPLISRPAQVYSRPDDSQSTFGASFNNIRPVDHEHVQSAFKDPILTYEENKPVFRPLLSRPVQDNSRPDDSVSTFDTTFNRYQPVDRVANPFQPAYEEFEPEYVGGQAAFRPIISRPAQVYRRPEDMQTPFNTFYSFPRLSEHIIQTPASTRPLAEVRRPLEHLHFPRYVPYNVFSSRPEDEEAK